MTIKIGSNIASLTAQRRLGEATSALSKSYEKLSSGLRINRASDDAAGLAISETLKANTRVYAQGIRNINDAISALNITEGGLSQLSNITIRQKELATQAASGLFSSRQRSALQTEADALTQEFNRIVETTSFNGRKMLDSSLEELRIQAGAGVDESLWIKLGEKIATTTTTLNGATTQSFTATGGVTQVIQVNIPSSETLVPPPGGEHAEFTMAITQIEGSAPEYTYIDVLGGAGAFTAGSGFGVYVGYLWEFYFSIDGDNGGYSGMGVEIALSSGWAVEDIVSSIVSIVGGVAPMDLSATYSGNQVQIQTATIGDFTDSYTFGNPSGFSMSHLDGMTTSPTLLGHIQLFDNYGISYYLYFNNEGNVGSTGIGNGIEVNISHGMTRGDVSDQIASTINGATTLFSTTSMGDSVYIYATQDGDTNNWSATDFNITNYQQGSSSGSPLGTTSYVAFDTPTSTCYVWFNIDGAHSNPNLAGRTGVEMSLNSGSWPADIAADLATLITSTWGLSTSAGSGYVQISAGAAGDPADPTTGGFLSASVITQGEDPSVDPGLDTLIITGHGYSSGDKVQLSASGSLPGGLAAGTDYYVIKMDDNKIRLATSSSDALAGTTWVDLTSGGSGTVNISEFSSTSTGTTIQAATVDLTSAASARSALDTLDSQLSSISSELGVIGSFQSRLNAALAHFTTKKLMTAEAESRISAVDIAAESSALLRQQILQQSASAILAQANQIPSLALTLLQ